MRVFFSATVTCAGHGRPRMRRVGEPPLAEVVIVEVSDYKVPLDTGRRNTVNSTVYVSRGL